MALNVTFCAIAPANVPLMQAGTADTETIAVGGTSTQGSLVATKSLCVVSMVADEDCWVMIGANPTAVAGSGRKMTGGSRLELWCSPGQKVAAITAA